MLIPRITKPSSQPDKVFVICTNDEASTTLVNGDVVIWQTTTPKNYGSSVLKSTASANLITLAGVISGRDIAPGDTGLMQVYGYHPSVKSGTSTAGVSQKSVATVGTAGDGAAADGPAEYLGVCLKATASSRAGILIQKM